MQTDNNLPPHFYQKRHYFHFQLDKTIGLWYNYKKVYLQEVTIWTIRLIKDQSWVVCVQTNILI